METWHWIGLGLLVVAVAALDVRIVRAAREVLSLRQARRSVVFVLGSTVLLLGVVMLVTPGPGVAVILLGLGILAAEFAWAKRWLDRVKQMARDAGQRITKGGRERRSEEPTAPDSSEAPDSESPYTPGAMAHPTDDDWREKLSPIQYHVTREGGTEPPFSGKYWDTKTPGTYHCVCCDLPLFRSDAKFESGCGWPSFFEPLEGANLRELHDDSHGMIRTEIRCNRCDAHLGHVFDDGPPPTGIRFCINSASIQLEEQT